jgi:hypothetical protein
MSYPRRRVSICAEDYLSTHWENSSIQSGENATHKELTIMVCVSYPHLREDRLCAVPAPAKAWSGYPDVWMNLRNQRDRNGPIDTLPLKRGNLVPGPSREGCGWGQRQSYQNIHARRGFAIPVYRSSTGYNPCIYSRYYQNSNLIGSFIPPRHSQRTVICWAPPISGIN